jgi:peroxiredoxin Q/BCP
LTFSLLDQDGQTRALADYTGRWLVLYFYPKDDTPGCTTEACSFRDSFQEFTKRGIEVIGISVDPVKSHKKFTEKYQLPFTLLSDTEKTMVANYDVWATKKMYGKEYMGILRTTYLIDPKGMIAAVYENVKPETHIEQILVDTVANA